MNDAATPSSSAEKPGNGLPYALGAYGIWGLMPIYIVLLSTVDPFRLVAWRALWTIPVCLVALALFRDLPKLRRALCDRAVRRILLLSSLLICANWLIYVAAVQAGHFYAASLGYYINPLVNVLLGTVFLKERLSRLQWMAVAIAAVAIAVLAFRAQATLAISVTLAVTFGIYGLLRKQVRVDALPGLTIEVLWLTPLAIGALLLMPVGAEDFGDNWRISLLLAGAGIATGVPLLLFAAAARRMTYSALGFVQFLAPTMVFLFGLLVYHEELRTAQAVCFALIWSAIALFCWDIMARSRRAAAPA